MLWACIHLPQLPLEVFQQNPLPSPLVIEEIARNRRYVAYANQAAQECGIQRGSSIATAHSLIAGLTVKQRDLIREQQGLDHMAMLAYSFTSTVSIQKPNQILMDIASSLRLFNGIDGLHQKLSQALTDTPFSAYVVYYDTAAGARLLANAKPLDNNHGQRCSDDELRQCPIIYLDITVDTKERLQSMGFHQVGELLDLPKDSLSKRFGKAFSDYLNYLSGDQPQLLANFKLPPQFDRRIDFVEELTHTEALLFPIKRLTHYLQSYLIARQLYVRSFVLTLTERFQQQQSLVIQLSKPNYSAAHILNLIQHQLNKIQLTQPVIGVRLKAQWFCPLESDHQDLFKHHSTTHKDHYQLVDTLRARLGRDAVHGLCINEDHRPEKAWQMSIPGEGKTVEYPGDKRPLWLLKQPQFLPDKKGSPVYGEHLQLMKGPERIETGWWDHQAVQRDYYIAAHSNGSLFWIFKDHQQQGKWYLHGLFT